MMSQDKFVKINTDNFGQQNTIPQMEESNKVEFGDNDEWTMLDESIENG